MNLIEIAKAAREAPDYEERLEELRIAIADGELTLADEAKFLGILPEELAEILKPPQVQ